MTWELRRLVALAAWLAAAFTQGRLHAQPYDLLLRGGRIMDPGNGIDARMDLAVTGDHIAAVQANIPAAQARRVIDVAGSYVVPGLVDLHVHVFGYAGSLVPDETSLPFRRHYRGGRRRERLANLRRVPPHGHLEIENACAGAAEHRG